MKIREDKKYKALKYSIAIVFAVVFLAGVFSRSIGNQGNSIPVNPDEGEKSGWEVAIVDGGLSDSKEPDLKSRREIGDKLREDPENAQLHNEMGIALAKDGLFSEAIMHFQSAIEKDPLFAEAYHNLGIVNEYLENYDIAHSYLEKAHELNPDSRIIARTLNRVGFVLEYQPKGAEKYESDLNKALNAMGKGSSNLEYAELTLNSLILENPSRMEALNALGVVKARTGDKDKAIEIFKNVIEQEPGYVFAYVNLATVYESSYEYQTAIDYLTKALNLADDAKSQNELRKRISRLERLAE